jgi:hypothetical protein
MGIVLNEKEWAENAIANRQLGARPIETLSRVARYLHQVEGYKKPEVRKRIGDFLIQCDPNAVLVKWSDMLDSLAKNADRYPLIEIDGVNITEGELKSIEMLTGRQSKRLAFTLLCVAKYWDAAQSQNNAWVNTSDKEIMRMANVNTSIRRQNTMLHDMKESGMLRFSKKVDNLNIQVQFMQPDSPTILHISDFRNIGNQYLLYCGEKYFRCAHCGLTIKRRVHAHKYCSDCAAEMYIKKSVESVMRQRVGRNPVKIGAV